MIERGGALVPAAYAARRIGVTPRTIRRWIAGGVLQGRAVPSYARDRRCRWFVLRAALDAWLTAT